MDKISNSMSLRNARQCPIAGRQIPHPPISLPLLFLRRHFISLPILITSELSKSKSLLLPDLLDAAISGQIRSSLAMNDDGDVPSQYASPCPSSRSPTPSPSSAPITVVRPSSTPLLNGHHSGSVTVAATGPLHQTLTLALPIQNTPGSTPAGGGRDDCWSEGATSALIDAWGERFLELSRGNLKRKQWQEVADVVSSREDYSKTPRTDVQCKNRIDTLKKRHKLEKAKMAAGSLSSSSSWPFFQRLDLLLGPYLKPSPSTAPKQRLDAAVATAARSQIPQRQRTILLAKRKASPPQAASGPSTSNRFPPDVAQPPPANGRRGVGLSAAGLRKLTRAIVNFGEVYQRVESTKMQQAVEMERQRIGFARELEMQRMQFFMKTQMELSQLKLRRLRRPLKVPGEGGGGSINHHHCRRRHLQTLVNNNEGNEDSG